MRALNIFLGILFVVFAALQYNDMDPVIWVPIYGYAAVVCFMAAANRYNKWMILAGLVIYFVYMIRFIPGLESWFFEHEHENIAQTMKATKPWIEETREFFGLLILVIVFIFHYYRKRRQGTGR
ncbi:transmembrane family 220 protein [Anseongella ginsenosidimutans]|uniref:Transmembrane family 220 protein n=1 Tax=Anseongella ginsenosidimutans TaxID=496056 RepID=A0A4R3KUA1_9SPHI|nr:transmembrane 220 family protein [Anseongella ginsenosidimutans]QEC53485.1 hypothetical protein FRZ59_14845 [Anseongella ginsenosidimutans]TCS88383.1 transmembrane family 220 protein [Anseongella ginsenosidimutans]